MNYRILKFKCNTFGKLVIAFVFAMLLTIFFGVNIANAASPSSNDSTVSNSTSSFYDYLDSVPEVDSIESLPTSAFAEKYLFTVEQPLDWNNPSGEKIHQRVLVFLRDVDSLNFLNLEGYDMLEQFITGEDVENKRMELAQHYNGNLIFVEHRYFVDSSPAGLDNTKPDKWEFLTTEFAAHDHHHIFQILKKSLPNKWTSQGFSKGGETCLMYKYYWPNDIDVVVPYVAPWTSQYDMRGIDFIYTEAGNEQYGLQKAQELRDLCLRISLEYFTHKDIFYPKFVKDMEGLTYYTDVYGEKTLKILYETGVVNVIWGTWQYNQNFAILQEIDELSWDTQAEKKAEMLFAFYNGEYSNDRYAFSPLKLSNNPDFAYWVQTEKELGNYVPSLKYIREALKDTPGLVETTPEEEPGSYNKIAMSPELRTVLHYDDTVYNGLKAWYKNTDAKIINIYGSSDPWYAQRLDSVEGKENIINFVSYTHPHTARISSLQPADQENLWNTLDKWLSNSPTPPNPEVPAVTQSAQTSDFNWILIVAISTVFLFSLIINRRQLVVGIIEKYINSNL